MFIADFQTWLDRMAKASLAGDFDQLGAAISLPLVVLWADGLSIIQDRDQLRRVFDNQAAMIAINRVTDLVLSARTLRMLTPLKVQGDFGVEMLSNGIRVMEPFVSSVTLRRDASGWRMTKQVSGLSPRYRYLVHVDTRPVPSLFAKPPRSGPGGNSLRRSA